MSREPEIQGMTVVLLGDFNPKIFQPAWFGGQGLIRQTEADEADVKIVHPDVVEFSLDWLVVQVTRERFSADTQQDAFFEAMRDLVLGTFDLLSHTPLTRMGINMAMHYRMESEDAWHEFGHRLAPKDLWQGVLEKPGLMNLTMQGARPDNHKGHIQVQAQPSRRVPNGILLNVNDHYDAKEEQLPSGAGAIMTMLRDNWETSVGRSKYIIEQLMEA
jgi:hypothetical protein